MSVSSNWGESLLSGGAVALVAWVGGAITDRRRTHNKRESVKEDRVDEMYKAWAGEEATKSVPHPAPGGQERISTLEQQVNDILIPQLNALQGQMTTLLKRTKLNGGDDKDNLADALFRIENAIHPIALALQNHDSVGDGERCALCNRRREDDIHS